MRSVQITIRHQSVLQTFQVLLGSRQGDATLVPYHYWAHGFQSATGGPGPKRASIYIGPPNIEQFQ